MTLEQLLASYLCAAAEQAYHKEREHQRLVPRFGISGPVRGLLRWAGKLAAHYDLIPERTYDDGPDEYN